MAGLARMSLGRFTAALATGCVPTALFFAWLGYVSRAAPWYGTILAVGIPMVAWPVLLRLVAPAPGRKR